MFGILDYSALVAAFVLLLFIPGSGNLALIASTGRGRLIGVVLITHYAAENSGETLRVVRRCKSLRVFF